MLLLGCAVTAVAAALLSTPRPATAQFACVDASSSPQGATVTNPGDVACGPGATATGGGTFSTGATALGDSAFALGSATTTVGANAGSGVSVNGVTSIGANTNNSPSAPGVFSTAVGAGLLSLGDTTAAKSIGAYSIAIGGGDGVGGTGAVSGGDRSIAIGLNSLSSGTNSVAVGAGSEAAGLNSSAFGPLSLADGNRSTAVGFFSTAAGNNSSAFGDRATAFGDNSTAIGHESFATGQRSTAVGAQAVAFGNNATAVGEKSTAFENNSSAFGTGSAALGLRSTALGAFSLAEGNNSVAVGFLSAASGNSAIAVGNNAFAAGNRSIAIGLNATTFDFGTSTAFVDAVAIGNNAKALATGGVAIGLNSSVTASNSVALGQGSVANVANTVSVGSAGNERKIVNVAPGALSATSTDAVNGSQLFNTNTNLANLQTQITGGTIGLVQQAGPGQPITVGVATDGTVVNFTGTAGTRVLTGVSAGALSAASTDAVNGGQLFNTNTNLANLQTQISGGTIGLVQQAGPGQPITVGAATDGTIVNFTGTAGTRVLTGVSGGALSAASTDAVNGGQLFNTNSNVTNLQTQISNGSIGLVQQAGPGQPITVGAATDGTVVNFAGTAGTRVLTGISPGALTSSSTDAVNGSQLFTANERVAAAFGTTLDGAGQLIAPSYTIQGSIFNNVGGAFNAVDNALTTNKNSITSLQNQINSGSIGLVQQNPGTKVITVGANTDGTVVNVAGTAGDRLLTGVSTGVLSATSTDAVNGSQLFATNQQVGTLSGQVATNTADIATLNSTVAGISQSGQYVKVNSTGTPANASGANAIAIGSGAQATQSGSIAMGLNSSSTGTNAIAIGTGASATGSVAIGAQASASNGGAAYGDGASATGTNSAALGPGSTATAANSVSLGSGSIANVPNTVSVGAPGNERRITNVAAGIAPTDAVNVSQLQSVATGLGTQIVGVQQQLNQVDRKLRDGVALAMASGGVPSVPTGRKVGVFGNIAGYDGHGAAGFGITGVLYDTQTYSVQANGAFGVGFDTGVVGGRGGVSIFW